MSRNMKLTVASVAGLVVCTGCDWMSALFVTGAIGGVTYLAQTVAALFGVTL